MHKIQSILSKYCDVEPWDKDVFRVGDFTLEDLHRKVVQSHFALLIIYPDDEIVKRDETGYTARDNVLFELGLFMGVLGRHRSFCLLVSDKRGGKSKEVLIPSDLAGLQRLNITLVDDETKFNSDLQLVCKELKKGIEDGEDTMSFTMFPSTSLAIGYFHNFIVQVCKSLFQTSNYKIGGTMYDFTRGNFQFYIVLPDMWADAGYEGFARFLTNRGLKKIEIQGFDKVRTFPFFIDSLPHDGRIALYDYPTTLNASYLAIEYIGESNSMTTKEREIMGHREIVNFERTLRHLLDTKGEAAQFRDKVSILHVNELTRRIS